MTLFSQRQGFQPVSKAIQREWLDDELKNRIWSGLRVLIFDKWQKGAEQPNLTSLMKRLWIDFLKQPLDVMELHRYPRNSQAFEQTVSVFRQLFFKGEWWWALDFVEFLVKSPLVTNQQLVPAINRYLTEENSAYRIVGDEIVEISDSNEIEAIESALVSAGDATKLHLTRALELLSDKQQPDYRNSIKESILAVEAVCQKITGSDKATLGECLKVLESRSPIHPALNSALSKLYGYTSDSGGIRHALTEAEQQPAYSDAKFMIVAASAFIGYVLAKSAEAQR